MRRHRPFFATLVLTALLAVQAAAQHEGVHWQTEIEGAKALARQTNRLVLVHFWTPTCGPCMMLNQNVFNQAGVASALEAQFVPVKLNANENSATAMGFGITRVPTDVIITPDGEMVGKLISPPTPAAYLAEVSQLANQYATKSGRAFASAAAAAPMQPARMNSAYASLPVTSATPPVMASANQAAGGDKAATAASAAGPNNMWPSFGAVGSSATAAQGNSVPFNPPPAVATAALAAAAQPQMAAQAPPPMGAQSAAQAASDRYASLTPAGQVQPQTPVQPVSSAPTPPAVVNNRYAAVPQAQSAAAPASPTGPAFDNRAFAQQPPSAVQVPPLASMQTAPIAGAQFASAQAPVATLGVPDPRQLPAGAPPLGFDGYCPVSMRNSNLTKWVPGDPRYGIVHRGRTYWFAGANEQKQFWENPDRFTPALSGIDPVLAIDHKQEVPGKREHSLDYDNLFYLFSSEATLQQFAANPERYAAGVRQAMGIERGRLVR